MNGFDMLARIKGIVIAWNQIVKENDLREEQLAFVTQNAMERITRIIEEGDEK